MAEGFISKSISGFYTVTSDGNEYVCRARGKFRKEGTSPLAGDRVEFSMSGDSGIIDTILPRRNSFIRPSVANIDQMVIIASSTIPITDPFLIDRIAAIAVLNHCEPVICINKCDIDPADELYHIYKNSGFKVLRCSAEDGTGIDELRAVLIGKISVFTGNSGVGKSSILNKLSPGFSIQTGEVSDKLGRGRHTTRHIEFYKLCDDTYIADTPGFSSFDTDILTSENANEIASAYKEFSPFSDKCRFPDCTHTREDGCEVLSAVKNGIISEIRHKNYVRLFDMAMSVKQWEIKK